MIFYIITYPKFFCQRVQLFFSNILENLTENLFVLVCQSSAPRLRRLNRIHNKNMSQFSSQFEVKNCTLWQLLSEKWYYKMLFSIKFWTTFYYFVFFAVIQRVIILFSIQVRCRSINIFVTIYFANNYYNIAGKGFVLRNRL